MLAAKVEDMINTVVRQIAFYTFERKLHTERRKGELTAERLDAIWLEVQSESLGPGDRAASPGYETFWAYIPHFVHSPFYVYAYAFGDCLVNSLYAVYERAPRASPSATSRCWRPAAPSTIPSCWRRSASTPATRLLAGGAGRDRADDRRAGGDGLSSRPIPQSSRTASGRCSGGNASIVALQQRGASNSTSAPLPWLQAA